MIFARLGKVSFSKMPGLDRLRSRSDQTGRQPWRPCLPCGEPCHPERPVPKSTQPRAAHLKGDKRRDTDAPEPDRETGPSASPSALPFRPNRTAVPYGRSGSWSDVNFADLASRPAPHDFNRFTRRPVFSTWFAHLSGDALLSGGRGTFLRGRTRSAASGRSMKLAASSAPDTCGSVAGGPSVETVTASNLSPAYISLMIDEGLRVQESDNLSLSRRRSSMSEWRRRCRSCRRHCRSLEQLPSGAADTGRS